MCNRPVMKWPASLFLGLLLVAGCSESPKVSDRVAPAPRSTEFVNGGECTPSGYEGLPDAAGCATTVTGDAGQLTVYALVDEDERPKRWRVHLESADGSTDQPLEAGNPFSYPRALAAIDVDDDGVEEWVIKNVDLAGHGTNWQRLELLVVRDDELVPVTLDGEPFYVNVGGTSRLGEGARCDGKHFVLLRTEAENRQNTTWSFSERMYEIRGHEAVFLDRRSGTLELSDYNDPQLDPYYRITCGELLYP